jgi:hypothetical protein
MSTTSSLSIINDINLLNNINISILKDIYENSFPETVQSEWKSLINIREDEEMLILIDDSTPVGMLIYRKLGLTSKIFVRYIFINTLNRGNGYGSYLLKYFIKRVKMNKDFISILLDVEDPLYSPTSIDEINDGKRILFYKKFGISKLPIQNYAPPGN